ncbi:ribosome silencing factor [Peptoniphilus sp. GNH]|nr:ribosome silencing factor [Peptoniphilus sp. GNH]
METKKKLEIIKNAGLDKLASDIEILDIRQRNGLSDYFIIMSADSSRQVQTIAEYIEEKMFEEKEEAIHKEGYGSNRWIILDYSDVICHVFHKEEREYYNIERLWSDSKSILEKKEEN